MLVVLLFFCGKSECGIGLHCSLLYDCTVLSWCLLYFILMLFVLFTVNFVILGLRATMLLNLNLNHHHHHRVPCPVTDVAVPTSMLQACQFCAAMNTSSTLNLSHTSTFMEFSDKEASFITPRLLTNC